MRAINIKNNLNNRLLNDYFSIIHLAPPQLIPESKVEEDFSFTVEDKSVEPFVATRITLARLKLYELSSVNTYLASGKPRETFIMDFMAEQNLPHDSYDIAIYIFKRKQQ